MLYSMSDIQKGLKKVVILVVRREEKMIFLINILHY